MRKKGFYAEVVEHRSGIFRKDLLGVADVLSFDRNGFVFIQAYQKGTEKAHSHMTGLHPVVSAIKRAGGKFVHHIWRKSGARGKRKVWQVEEVVI